MKMIPNYLKHSKSRAEIKVFDKLRNTSNKDGWFAFHSLNLSQHAKKRFGEADFVICGPGGCFILEVKGGRVSCEEGEWKTIDAHDNESILKEAPYEQAEGALHALRKKINNDFNINFEHCFPVYGYGVITPDCTVKPIGSVEWDKQIWAGAEEFRNFDKWFNQFIKYWKKIALDRAGIKDTSISAESVKEFVKILRPDFESATPLFDIVDGAEEVIASMTDEQLHFVDIIEQNKRVLCGGGAGTGKTFLAVELARRWSTIDRNIAFCCHSPWLKRFIEGFSIPNVSVATIDGLGVAAKRKGVECFDSIIIDEGQDVINFDSLGEIGALLNGGIENGKWCIFNDVNNQTGVLGKYDPEAFAYLREIAPVDVPLRRNCRNTSQILKKIQSSLNVDMGNTSRGSGPEVLEFDASPDEPASAVLRREIRNLLRDGQFTAPQIVVLSPKRFSESAAFELRSDSKARVIELDSYSLNRSGSSIGFACISDFKGLESEIVFLIDLPRYEDALENKSMYYIGMSRARVLLYVIAH